MKTRIGLLLTLLLVLCAFSAFAQEAADITDKCAIADSHGKTKYAEIFDHNYKTYRPVRKGGWLQVQSDVPVSGVYFQLYERPTLCVVEVKDGDDWVQAGEGGGYLSEWFPLPAGTKEFRVRNTSKARMFVAEFAVYGEGDKPRQVQAWTTLDKADLMLMVAHPDDEVLWFGGLLPTYAGERGLKVQVVCIVPTTPNRRLELLDCLWHCGVTAYPAFSCLRDVYADSLEGQYKLWNKRQLRDAEITMIRTYRPEVLVTHDFRGEYGHGAHRATADMAAKCVTKDAADSKIKPKSAKGLEPWQVKKLYVHLYGENRLKLDWHTPLSAFGGKDGLTVATEALAYHASQQKRGWKMTDGGEYDNSLFGLYYTTVGADDTGDDLMEHIDPMST